MPTMTLRRPIFVFFQISSSATCDGWWKCWKVVVACECIAQWWTFCRGESWEYEIRVVLEKLLSRYFWHFRGVNLATIEIISHVKAAGMRLLSKVICGHCTEFHFQFSAVRLQKLFARKKIVLRSDTFIRLRMSLNISVSCLNRKSETCFRVHVWTETLASRIHFLNKKFT